MISVIIIGNDDNYMLSVEIKKLIQRHYVENNPELKEHLVFHGGCLSCKTPLEQGIGICQGCFYNRIL